jgi:hypothetical protein
MVWCNRCMCGKFGASALDNECLTNWHCMAAEDVKRDIVDFIEVFYDGERLHSHTGYLCSNKYEALVKTLV